MKRLALYDFLRHIKRNLFVSLLLAILCLLMTGLYSLFRYEYGRYQPFASLEIQHGFYIGGIAFGDIQPTELLERLGELDEVSNLYQVYSAWMSTPGGLNVGCSAYLYEEWIWKNWQARLQSGAWFEDYDADSEWIQVVVGGNAEGFLVGDTFTCKTDTGVYPCKVQGILQADTEILGSQDLDMYEIHYDAAYTVPDGEKTFFLVQKEAADAIGIVSYPVSAWSVVAYKEGLSEERVQELNFQISTWISRAGRSYASFLAISKKLLMEDLLVYLPLIATGALLIFVSLFSVAFINVEQGSRYYRIYYLVGASKRKCFWIAGGNVFGTIVLSVFFYVMGSRIFELYARKNNLAYSLAMQMNWLVAALYFLFAGCLLFFLWYAMRKQSPLDFLREKTL